MKQSKAKAIWLIFDLFLLVSIGSILVLILIPRLSCQITRLIKAELFIPLKDVFEDTVLVDYPDYEDIEDDLSDYKNPNRDNDDASEDLPRDYFDYDDSRISIRPCRPTCHLPYVCDTRHGYCVKQNQKTSTKEPKTVH